MPGRLGNATYPESAALPQILMVDLGYRDIELVLHVCNHRPHHLSLGLKRSAGRNEEIEAGYTYEH